MHTNLQHDEIETAVDYHLRTVTCARQRALRLGERRTSVRGRKSVVLPRGKCSLRECRFGQLYEGEKLVQVDFNDIRDVSRWANEMSYMFVGTQLRRYVLGVPMGAPMACFQALATTKRCEDVCNEKMEDSERNVSVCVMDDLFLQILYDPSETQGGGGW